MADAIHPSVAHFEARMAESRGAHVTVWPGDLRHSNHRRPIVYRGTASKVWFVDDSGVNPDAWLDEYLQRGFARWRDALDYALAQTAAHAATPMP